MSGPCIERTILLISGMRGDACRARVLDVIEHVRGVARADVNLFRATAVVEHEPWCPVEAIIAGVGAAGYAAARPDIPSFDTQGGYNREARPTPIPPAKNAPDMVTLKIDGMSCQHCVQHVTRVLAAVPGVTARRVEIGRAELDVTDSAALQPIISALADEGYDARVVPDPAAPRVGQ